MLKLLNYLVLNWLKLDCVLIECYAFIIFDGSVNISSNGEELGCIEKITIYDLKWIPCLPKGSACTRSTAEEFIQRA